MNAIKFTHTNGTITLHAEWDGTSTVPAILFSVADNGIGMSQEQLDTLFELQPKGNHTRNGTNQEKGSGLGLVICNEFIETRHQGKIWAEANTSKDEGSSIGTIIKIRIPQPSKA